MILIIHVYLDDVRRCPEGFTLAKTAAECLFLLKQCEVDILSLDHDLGWDEPDGTELVRQMVLEQTYAKRIFLHSSDPAARHRMYELLHAGKPEHVMLYPHPVPPPLLEEVKA